MATVHIPAPLRPLCGGARVLQADGATLEGVLRALDDRFPGFYDRVVEGGAVRPELAIAVDGEVAGLALHERVRPEADIAIIPAISGG